MKAPWKRINDADVYVNWLWGREKVHVTQDGYSIATKIGKLVSKGRLTTFAKEALTAITLTDYTDSQKQELALFLLCRVLDAETGEVLEENLTQWKRYVSQKNLESARWKITLYEMQ